MQRIERVVVHIQEALRLAGSDDESRVRLSLILFDSAVELLLYRECTDRLNTDRMYGGLLESLRRIESQQPSPEIAGSRREMEGRVLSGRRRKRIEREFNAKVDYLVEDGKLALAHGRLLKKLHRYRNETYHQDRVRSETLKPAVRIYGYLACTLLRDMPVHMVAWTMGETLPHNLRPYLADSNRPVSFELQRTIAESLLHDLAIDEEGLGAELSDHLQSRLSEIDEMLEFARDEVNAAGDGRSPLESGDVLTLLQMTDRHMSAFETRQELRALPVDVTVETLAGWKYRAIRLADEKDPLRAFAEFADVEDAFEPIEGLLVDVIVQLDQQIQLAIDQSLGK